MLLSDAKLVAMTSEEAVEKPEDKASSIDSGNNTNSSSQVHISKVRHRNARLIIYSHEH